MAATHRPGTLVKIKVADGLFRFTRGGSTIAELARRSWYKEDPWVLMWIDVFGAARSERFPTLRAAEKGLKEMVK